MLSRRCAPLLLLLFATMTTVHNNVIKRKADKFYVQEKELAKNISEIPQADESVDQPTVGEDDPCAPFVNIDYEKREFYSPGYPNMYPPNIECVTVLEAPPGHIIQLDFRDKFMIEGSTDCMYDFLEVRDGRYGFDKVIQHPFCGDQFPPELRSTDRHMWIHFKSDATIVSDGFKAVFQFLERPESLKTPEKMQCTIYKSGEQGFVSTDDIPKDYKEFVVKNNMPIDCLWNITVMEIKKIQIKIPTFDLSKPNDCEANFLDVFSDNTDIPSRKKNFCGSVADSVASNRNKMFLRLYTDSTAFSSVFRGFFTAFREYKKTSNDEEKCIKGLEFDCEDATCIHIDLKCNKVANCRFQWDEDECLGSEDGDEEETKEIDDRMIIIIVIFCLILSGMCFAFMFNCAKKLIRDHQIIQEHIRQSREQQLNELGKQESLDKKLTADHRSRSNSSLDSERFASVNAIVPDTNCYVPGGDLLPILIRSDQSLTPNGDTYNNQTVRTYAAENGSQPEMCDSACQTRESLFYPQEYSSGHSTPNHSVTSNSKPSPPAPFSTFGYKKDSRFKAEARIEMEDKRRPYSVQTTKSAPDVIVTH